MKKTLVNKLIFELGLQNWFLVFIFQYMLYSGCLKACVLYIFLYFTKRKPLKDYGKLLFILPEPLFWYSRNGNI